MYDRAKLSFSADVDRDGTEEDLTFVFSGNLTIELSTVNSPIINQQFSRFNSVVSDWLDAEDGTGGRRQGFVVEFGSGQHFCQIDMAGWEGSDDQWGTGDGTDTDATGADPRTQMSLLDRAFQVATIDSRPGNGATLEVAEYSTDGRFDPLQVGPVDPTFTWDATESASLFDGSIRFVEIGTLGTAYDGRNQRE
jgi:hypothetical protein